jgi:ankyrin repeat protein
VKSQDKLLGGAEYRALLKIADTAFTAVISTESGDTVMDDEAPPPYDENISKAACHTKTPKPAASSLAASSSSQTAPQSKFSGLFRALAAPFRYKPEPLVTVLCEASSRGDSKTVASLISSGASIDGRNEEGKTPLVIAIENHQLDVLTKLLELGASKDVRDSAKKLPPLFWAASAGDIPTTKLLLQHGCNPNHKNMCGHAYFLDIIDKGDVEMVQLLLDHGANANTTDLYGRPAIHHAYSANKLAMLKLLQSYGGSVNAKDMMGSPLIVLALRDKRDEVVDFLLECGADVNVVNWANNGNPLMVDAFLRRRIDTIKKLLDRGADPNAKDNVGTSILISAVKVESKTLGADDREELISLLLNYGANPNDSDLWGKSAASFIVERGLFSLVPLLMEKGLDLSKPLSNGETLAEYARRNHNLELQAAIIRHYEKGNGTKQQK